VHGWALEGLEQRERCSSIRCVRPTRSNWGREVNPSLLSAVRVVDYEAKPEVKAGTRTFFVYISQDWTRSHRGKEVLKSISTGKWPISNRLLFRGERRNGKVKVRHAGEEGQRGEKLRRPALLNG